MKRLTAIAVLCVVGLAAGCNDFERNTFNTLASSKAVIDQSQADYEAHVIPHNQCAYDLINKAKAAQTVAVDAMLVYEQEKAAKKDLSAQQGIVLADVALVAPIIAQVKTISSGACGGAK